VLNSGCALLDQPFLAPPGRRLPAVAVAAISPKNHSERTVRGYAELTGLTGPSFYGGAASPDTIHPVRARARWLSVILGAALMTALCRPVCAQTDPASQPEILQPDQNQQGNALANSADSVDGNLQDATTQRAGVFKYGPVTLIEPYWKSLAADLGNDGIQLGMSYTMVYQDPNGAKTSAPPAAGGDFDLFGNWRLLGPPDGHNNGYLFFSFEQRSSIGYNGPPKDIGREIGSLWATTNGFNNEPFLVKELYWQQDFDDQNIILRAGRLDPTNYYDTNYWQSDSKYFMNQAFSSFPVRSFPSSGVGFNLKAAITDWLTLSTGVQNAQGNATLQSIGDTWNQFSPFSATELALVPNIKGLGQGNYRFTYWYRSVSADNETPHDGGFDLSCDQQFGNIIPFLRYGYSEAKVNDIMNMVSAGVGIPSNLLTRSDVVGAAFSWGDPEAANLRSQYATEIFYRLQTSSDTQITAGYQIIIDPTNQPDENLVGVFELRWRVAF
jgi:hypothetical protein